MEISEDRKLLSPAKKKIDTNVSASTETYTQKSEQQKTPDKKSSAPPAPFYDELHFADYE
ncbi:MAG TPA: hypothetical protein VEV83_03055 [Parafilimonas sp.]|nr:hypothetical protein [Parafilimonas sp.]